MKVFSIALEAMFNDEDEVRLIEKKYHLSIANVTKFYVDLYETRNPSKEYCGPAVYLFVGSIVDLYEYFKYGYGVNDDEEFRSIMSEVKVCEI